jgi:phosphohistidine phosphatase SixA
VTDWQGAALVVMAAALVVMAVIQVAAIVAALRLARQVTATTEALRREVRPLIDQVRRVADEAERASRLATAQMARVDQLLASMAVRVEETVDVVQGALVGPLRQGAAVVTAVRAALSVFRTWQRRPRRTREDTDDVMFVG